MRTIIIEDEQDAQYLLSSILEEFCPGIEIIGSATSVSKGISIIEKLKPDLVFLDIEIEGGHSFQILDAITQQNFKIVFTTAYDQYALKAFEYNAIHYLLKPYSPHQVINAISRINNKEQKLGSYDKIKAYLEENVNLNNRITVSTAEGVSVFKVSEIIRIEADRSYCYIYQNNGKKLLVSRPLKEIESLLPTNLFFRIHSAHLVNINYVERIKNEVGDQVELNNGTLLPLSRRRRSDFLKLLSQ